MEENKNKILALLLMKNNITVDDISNTISTTNNKVFEHIQEINESFKYPVIYNKGDVYLIEENSIDFIYNSLTKMEAFVISREIRILLLKILITTEQFNGSLVELSEVIEVSKNTALKGINSIRSELNETLLTISYSQKNGYFMNGEEIDIRKFLIESIHELLSIPIGKFLLRKKSLIDSNEDELLFKKLEKVESRLDVTFSDDVTETLPFNILLLIKRMENNSNKCYFSVDVSEIIETKEYATITPIFWNYEFLKENDLIYLTILILSSNLIDSNSNFYKTNKLLGSVNKFIKNIEQKLAVKFSTPENLKLNLLQHIKPALFRIELGIKIYNPLTEQFISEYKSIFQLVKQELKIFQTFTEKDFSNHEIAFISMIVLSNLMEYSQTLNEKPLKATVICKSGTSVSRLLNNTLQEIFPFIDFGNVLSLRQFELLDSNEENDFIFSTIPLNTNSTFFLVSPVLNSNEKEKLKSQVQRAIDNDSIKKAKFIISYLSDYLKNEKESEALDTVQNALTFKQSSENENLAVTELLNSEDQVSFIDSDISWDNIISLSFKPMINRGYITANYVERCEKSFYSSYEIMLIGPGVLLPHTAPEDDVIVPDIQINILNEPIIAPNGEEYQLIIALAPGENNEHLDWIIKLNELLTETDFKYKILQVSSKEEVLKLFRKEGIHA